MRGQPRPPAVQTTPAWERGSGGQVPQEGSPPTSPSGAAALDFRPSVNTHREQNGPAQPDTMGATTTGSPGTQAEQRVARSCRSPHSRTHPQDWLGPGQAILAPTHPRDGGGGTGQGTCGSLSPPRGLSHFLCHPFGATSHGWPSPVSWKTHFLGGWRWKLSGQDLVGLGLTLRGQAVLQHMQQG